MAVIHKSALELELERKEEELAHQRAVASDRRAKEHAFRLAKLRYVNQPRHKAWVKIAIAFAKAPAWVLLSVSLPILAARKVDIPQALLDFLSL